MIELLDEQTVSTLQRPGLQVRAPYPSTRIACVIAGGAGDHVPEDVRKTQPGNAEKTRVIDRYDNAEAAKLLL